MCSKQLSLFTIARVFILASLQKHFQYSKKNPTQKTVEYISLFLVLSSSLLLPISHSQKLSRNQLFSKKIGHFLHRFVRVAFRSSYIFLLHFLRLPSNAINQVLLHFLNTSHFSLLLQFVILPVAIATSGSLAAGPNE